MNKFHAQKAGAYDSKVEKFVADKFSIFIKAGLVSHFKRCRWHFVIIPELSHVEKYDVEYTTPKKHEKKVKHIVKKVIDEQAARYTPDFIYFDNETHEWVALEVKSFITMKQADYPLRRKLFRHAITMHNAKGRSQWRFDEIKM